ncbi:MAG: glycoside hydrolase family 13 protein [Croceitalea sp.]|nr:glycoside hydrolase family 13 protein [Croceitalea sp.]
MIRLGCQLLLVGAFLFANGLNGQIARIEPPNWWVGMKNTNLQLLVHGQNIANHSVSINSENQKSIELIGVQKADSLNYLFLDIDISNTVEPVTFTLVLTNDKGAVSEWPYELRARNQNKADFKGFDASDVVYLITPDRFANGNTSNDTYKNLAETTIDRSHNYKRHGGDIQGIIDHLDYISGMGFTALWSSPLLINDMPEQSYHGYAITDFYEVDPRFGTLDEYKLLAKECNELGIKLIMDQVANHCGLEHWWMKDLPFNDWINFQKSYVANEPIINTNHRRTVNQDPYASEKDSELMEKGWFVPAMPDLNQQNPFLANYIIQNSIWWIETLKLGGIRQDTYPYPNKEFMAAWAKAIIDEYPNFNIVGEEWSYNPLLVGYWQNNTTNKDSYKSYLPSTMDFPLQKALIEALTEEENWNSGLIKLYEALANDFNYSNPESILMFGDNHDMDRLYTQLGENLSLTKMALGFILTAPRIPQIYYGTEVLLQNTAKPGDHGLIRTDFPGGWKTDEVSAFTSKGLSVKQAEMQFYLKTLLQFRKKAAVLHSGITKHFAPKDGVYVMFRYTDNDMVMLIINKNNKSLNLDLKRFEEMNIGHMELINIPNGKIIQTGTSINLPPNEVMLLTKKQTND